jgi:putative Mg2+ transporter-C (MgtC) family protein
MTVIGLCLGGGQIELGIAATVLAALTLWALQWIDQRIPREHRAVVVIKAKPRDAAMVDLPAAVARLGYTAHFQKQTQHDEEQTAASFQISWKQPEVAGPPLNLINILNERYSVDSFEITSETRH